jgi:hypothetical protein
MRKVIITLIVATALAGAVAGPAAADVPNPNVSNSLTATTAAQSCRTPISWGVEGQYGAWGKYFDGCTARVRCPFTYCQLKPGSGGRLYSGPYFKMCNMRVRVYSATGALTTYRDYTGSSVTNACDARTYDWFVVRQGETITIQSNGVEDAYNHGSTGDVTSDVTLTWYSAGLRPPA